MTTRYITSQQLFYQKKKKITNKVMDILSFLSSLGDYGVEIIKHIVRICAIFLTTLGIVYSLGRMLNLVHKPDTKNVIALICLFTFSSVITYIYYPAPFLRMVWESFAYGAIATVAYVLIGWKLYSRMDSWLDRKGFKNKGKT